MQGAIVARIEIDYLKPIHLSSDPLLVELWVSRIGTSSFDIDYRIVQDGEDAAHAKSVIVTYDYESGRSRPMNDDERGLLDKYVITVDA
jgi:acyl-CoA thioester hydrolase